MSGEFVFKSSSEGSGKRNIRPGAHAAGMRAAYQHMQKTGNGLGRNIKLRSYQKSRNSRFHQAIRGRRDSVIAKISRASKPLLELRAHANVAADQSRRALDLVGAGV